MQRHLQNPILTRSDIPAIDSQLVDVSSVFNPGATRYRDQILLLLRVQSRGRETFLLPASGPDGITFKVWPELFKLPEFTGIGSRIYHVYDARITAFDDCYIITVAIDTDDGCRIGLLRTTDFRSVDYIGIPFDEDSRNAVLFPEKINGRFHMLYRPNRTNLDGGVASGSAIELATSADLKTWHSEGPVMEGRFHYWDELIGSGPPPIKTRRGWLHIYHGVATHFAASNIYQAGVILLDLEQPRRVIGRSRGNILEPRELYEMVGQVPNVVFPSGLIHVEPDSDGFVAGDSKLLVYYGAADTSVCLATTTVNALLEACDEV
ncbi:MAG: glycoside hydrolase family 130 protein [Candidatus Zixiibacteriota bacterium]